jgi:2-methylisocitrate lyase-like PEP mutase family enzyme
VAAAGFPVVATTSSGVAAALGYEDEQNAPAEEMLAAAARISGSVDVPVTVDAEAGYELQPSELVAALKSAGAAGCNLEETNHATGALRDPADQADWLRLVREAAVAEDYRLVINARIDVFLRGDDQDRLVPGALQRAQAYLEAGADCVYPIALHEPGALAAFVSEVAGPVNILATPQAHILATPQAHRLAELAALGVARISFGGLLHRQTMEQFGRSLSELDAGMSD